MLHFNTWRLFAAILLICFCSSSPSLAQRPTPIGQGRYLISPEAKASRVYPPGREAPELEFHNQSMADAAPYVPATSPFMAAKTTKLSPVPLGRASNIYSIVRPYQNQVAVDNDLDLVTFIHRQDVSIWGGGATNNGRLRYDLSIDQGLTFANDVGPLQTNYVNFGRYPNILTYNPSNSTNPFDSKAIYLGPTTAFPTPGWIGHLYGVSDVTLTGPIVPQPTEHYLFDNENTLIPGSLVEGLPGEFWAVELQDNGSETMDSIRVMKGVWNSTNQDVDWSVYAKLDAMYDKSFDGSIVTFGPQIAFSDNGMDGYISYLSNTTTGTDTNNSTILPCIIKTSDGGATWGTPIEVNLNAIPWMSDTLQSLWTTVDSTGDTIPASAGIATTGFEFDAVVDANGNPHIGVLIGSHGPGFGIFDAYAKFIADVWSPDGGATWQVKYICAALAFTGTFGTPDPVRMFHYIQMATDESRNRIFLSWADTDTSEFTGPNPNGVGFGVFEQLAPNLRIASWNITDGSITCPKRVTDHDFVWSGRSIFPTMAPKVIETNTSGEYKMAMVGPEMINNDPLGPVQFWYFGQDAVINDFDYMPLPNFSANWNNVLNGNCFFVDREEPGTSGILLLPAYPNPSEGTAAIRFYLPSPMEVQLDLRDVNGKEIAVLAQGDYPTGEHEVVLRDLGLAPGIYFYRLSTERETLSQRLLIQE